jgi:peroxiredoxin family protein
MAQIVLGIGNGAPQQLLLASAVVEKAALLGTEVHVYLFKGGLKAFRRLNRAYPADTEATPQGLREALGIWQTLRSRGWVRIHACPSYDMRGATARQEDFLPIVDDVVGLASYVERSEAKDALHVYFGPCAEEQDAEKPIRPVLRAL